VLGRILKENQDQSLELNVCSRPESRTERLFKKPLLMREITRQETGSLVGSENRAAGPRRDRSLCNGIRARLTFLISAAFLTLGAQGAFAQDPVGAATGTTGADPVGTATGTTGAQQASTCQTPRLTGLPKTPQLANATVHFKLTRVPAGGYYVVRAADAEVAGGTATGSTAKGQFVLPDQGTHAGKVLIAIVVETDSCSNAPWKLEKRILYKAAPAQAQAPATPATGGPAAPAAAAPAAPAKAAPQPPIKLPKFQKPLTQRLPQTGPPPSRRTWLTPLDGGARLDQKLSLPALSRLEQKTEKANSSNALLGLGIVAAILTLAGGGGFLVFSRRDKVLFDRAMTEQLKHLEEGDPGVGFSEDPDAPLAPVEAAPFAAAPVPISTEPISTEPISTEPISTEPIPAERISTEPLPTEGDPTEPLPTEPAPTEPLPIVAHSNGAPPSQHHAEVEAELQRILNEAGLEAGLEGILVDAREEAERSGIALDQDLMLQALCDEINGSAKLSDTRRDELRSMFAGIIAEEAQQAPADPEHVPAP
jgi:hypothetical protein